MNSAEFVTLLSSVLISVMGAIKAIQDRKAHDKALGGADAIAQAKTMQDIIRVNPTYVQQAEAMRAELEAARRQLRRE